MKQQVLVAGSTAAVLALMELKHPYFFLQDDNRDFFLPYFVHNLRGLLAGEIPQFNFHQSNGSASLASGQTAALYPPAYVATALSKVLFGHYFAAVDILAIAIILAGAAGWLAFFRKNGLSDDAASWGALACSLNSFMIYGGSSWLFVAVTGASFGWMLYFSVAFAHDSRWKSLAGLVMARLLLVYFGYVEYFIYAALFEAIVFLALTQLWKNQWRLLARYVWSWICTAALAAPLLLPMWRAAAVSAARSRQYSGGGLLFRIEARDWFAALMQPFSGSVPVDFSDAERYLGHIGYAAVALFSACLYLLLRRRFTPVQARYARTFLGIALIALLWSMGVGAEIVAFIPILNRFRWPVKLLLLGNLFFISAGVLALDYWLNQTFRRRRFLFGLIFAATAVNFAVLYAATPPKAFRTHLDRVPFDEPLKNEIADGKIFTMGFPLYDDRLSYGVGFDYATLWGLYHFAGYDPLIPRTNLRVQMGLDYELTYRGRPERLPFHYLRQWGVRWYIAGPQLRSYPSPPTGFRLVHDDANRSIYRDDLARPMVFWEDGSEAQHRIGPNSVEIQAAEPHGREVCVSFLWNKGFSGSLDGRPVPVGFNRFGQMVLSVPPGAHTIQLRYFNPQFGLGLWIAVIGLLAIAAIEYATADHADRAQSRHASANE